MVKQEFENKIIVSKRRSCLTINGQTGNSDVNSCLTIDGQKMMVNQEAAKKNVL